MKPRIAWRRLAQVDLHLPALAHLALALAPALDRILPLVLALLPLQLHLDQDLRLAPDLDLRQPLLPLQPLEPAPCSAKRSR